MKKSLLILLFSIALSVVKAQDRIITIQKDTIECRIISVGPDRISYEQKNTMNYITGKSIALSDVLQYFRTEQSVLDNNDRYSQKGRRQKPEKRYLFSMQGGLSHSLTNYGDFRSSVIGAGLSASKADDYIRQLKNGYHVDIGVHRLLTSYMGLGVNYSFNQSTAKGEFLINVYGGNNLPIYFNTPMEEKLYNHFVGPSVLFQQVPDKQQKIRISETLSPGIVLFRDESRGSQYTIYWGDNTGYSGTPPQYFENSNAVTKGKTIGVKGSLAIEYCFTSRLSAGVAGNFIWAELHKASFKSLNYEVDNQKLDSSVDLSHIDYGISVRYNF